MRNSARCSTFHGGEVINGTSCLDEVDENRQAVDLSRCSVYLGRNRLGHRCGSFFWNGAKSNSVAQELGHSSSPCKWFLPGLAPAQVSIPTENSATIVHSCILFQYLILRRKTFLHKGERKNHWNNDKLLNCSDKRQGSLHLSTATATSSGFPFWKLQVPSSGTSNSRWDLGYSTC